ncbi:MAG: glycoside hydrolase family 3 protein [Gillisia sp.]
MLLNCSSLNAQKKPQNTPEFLQYQNSSWIDSIMETLSPDERIAQLIMVAAFSNRDETHKEEILKLINEQKIGGVIFFQGGPVRQANLMNEYQAASKVPLLGAIDAEWGLGMRLDSTISFPFQMALGAVQDDREIYKMGAEVARQLKRAGLHLNFAPVVDVNNNADNPVINYRSFGENKFKVAKKGIAYMRGLQDHGVLPTAKHFPGHGDTDIDSHLALPQILHSRARLDSLELYPFREIIKAGIGGVMVAHLDIPALDASGVPSTLSAKIITELLKDELGFEGLIVTDAMNMKGVTMDNPPGIVDKDAILAGNDLLEFTEDVPRAISEISKAVAMGLILQEEIDRRCRKILALKQWAGLDNYKPTSVKNLTEDLNTSKAELLNRNLAAASLTLLKNTGNILPIKGLDTLEIAVISVGNENTTVFQNSMGLYGKTTNFNVSNQPSEEELKSLKNQLQKFDVLITGIHDEEIRPYNKLAMSDSFQKFISDLAEIKNSVIVLFKNPYVMKNLSNIELASGLLLTYQDTPEAENLAARAIYGKTRVSGKLPVSVGKKFREGDGVWLRGNFKRNMPCFKMQAWLQEHFYEQPVPWCLRR